LLSVARNFTPAQHDALVSHLGSLEALLDLTPADWGSLPLSGGALNRLRSAHGGCDIPAELARLREQAITPVGWGSAGYPELLAELPDAPLLLYVKGDAGLLRHHALAIVGSRKCTEAGKRIAYQLGAELADCGVPVASGLALGIDGAAHEGALSVHGPTVAVLGCGVDVVYPGQHHELYERICAEGAVASEYPPGEQPRKEYFPQRNRIISGLSKGTLVAEAPLGSGAIITAKLAMEQGREVFAVPGPVASPHVKGCHHLIKHGQAKLIENVDDVLAEFGETRASLRQSRRQPALPLEADAAAMGAADEAELRVLAALSYEGTHINEVVRQLGISTAECIAHLTLLEIKGLISTAGGGYYVRL
jgi:DNA processing protein